MQDKNRVIYALLNQADVWLPNGKPAVKITDMDESWRRNAAAYLVRTAKSHAFQYDLGLLSHIRDSGPREGTLAADRLDQDLLRRADAPEEWLKTTPLYKALVQDLPMEGATS
jgi:hypothetical protein